ncbi:MAG: SDR family NAD(P)-dependent oxidoreductase, partial [Pseudomonadota bacterium]
MGVSSVVFGMSQTQPTRVAERTERPSGPVYADLAGARVLLTGIAGETGAVLATHFAGQGSRMLVETNDELPLAAAVTTSSATVIHLRRTSDAASASARTTAQTAAKTFGSIDVAVNFVAMPQGPWPDIAAPDDLEDLIAERLSAAIVATQVTANRMGLTWTPGVIVNV